MNSWISQNYLLLVLLGFFLLLSFSLFLVARKQWAAARSEVPGGQEDSLEAKLIHEIANPLSVIKSAVTDLLRNSHDEVLREDLAMVYLELERVSHIIRKARGHASQNHSTEREEIGLKEVVRDALVFYSQLLRKHDIALHLKNLDGIYVEGNRADLENTLLEFLRTSIEEIDDLHEKWIEISAMRTDHHVRVVFRNSGRGLPLELERDIPEPETADPSTTSTNRLKPSVENRERSFRVHPHGNP